MNQLRNFHFGEAQLQAAAGVDTADFDQRVDQPFRPALNPNEITFVGERTFSVAASVDSRGRPWASPLFGMARELFAVETATTVRVTPRPIEGDPLRDNLEATGHMGVLYFDPSRRRRAKSLGTATVETDGSITYRMHRMFGLCTKYIFKRSHDPAIASSSSSETKPATATNKLSANDRAQLKANDTIFLASYSEQFGADPTHRGGPEGFITVVDDTTLSIPDYYGNNMFQTLGNLLLDNHIGLTSIDFATGRIVQLTGTGAIEAATPQGLESERTLIISIDEVRTSTVNIGQWTTIEPWSAI